VAVDEAVHWGPLWNVRVRGKQIAPKMGLSAYDTAVMLFLDRNGANYKISQYFFTNRGSITANALIRSLRTWHRLLIRSRGKDEVDSRLTYTELQRWWQLSAEDKKWANDELQREANLKGEEA
jgi:hypothetical protein